MPNTLVPIDVEGGEVGWSRSAGVDQWTVVYTNILTAVRQLSDILTSSPSLSPTPFPVAAPPPESHLRAPCLSGLCLFSTSLSPFPSPAQLAHPATKKTSGGWFRPGAGKEPSRLEAGLSVTPRFDPYLVSHVNEYEGRWGAVEGGYPSNAWWDNTGSWHLAVDGNGKETCWESWTVPADEDHFGLLLVTPRALHTLTLTGSGDLGWGTAWEGTTGGGGTWQVFTVGESEKHGWVSSPSSATSRVVRTLTRVAFPRLAGTTRLCAPADGHAHRPSAQRQVRGGGPQGEGDGPGRAQDAVQADRGARAGAREAG